MSCNVVHNLSLIQAEIKSVFDYYFLSPRPIKIIAVSKTQPSDAIIPLLRAGHRIFGENKVLEAYEKWLPLKQEYPDIELHLIGALQTNKVKKALQIFDVIQTIDRTSVVDEIIKHTDLMQHKQFFIQVNVGDESQKSGVAIDGFSELLTYTQTHALPISGLMCIPPATNPSHYFAVMQSLARMNGFLKLSAGMSSDYQKAIIHGTDYIRIGTAIFGERAIF
jgi:pyridoxal phosphate enzyme (YggS family)